MLLIMNMNIHTCMKTGNNNTRNYPIIHIIIVIINIITIILRILLHPPPLFLSWLYILFFFRCHMPACHFFFSQARKQTNQAKTQVEWRVETFTLCSPSFFFVYDVHMQITWVWMCCLYLAKCLAHSYFLFWISRMTTQKTKAIFSPYTQ